MTIFFVGLVLQKQKNCWVLVSITLRVCLGSLFPVWIHVDGPGIWTKTLVNPYGWVGILIQPNKALGRTWWPGYTRHGELVTPALLTRFDECGIDGDPAGLTRLLQDVGIRSPPQLDCPLPSCGMRRPPRLRLTHLLPLWRSTYMCRPAGEHIGGSRLSRR